MKSTDVMRPGLSDDIIARCRLLRSLAPRSARRHLFAMLEAVTDVLADYRPALVLSLTTDSFVIDCIRHGCKTKGIPFVGVLPSFVNGYFRITERGESNAQEVPSAEEVARVRRSLLNRAYTPAFNQSSVARPLLRSFERWVRGIVRIPFFMMRRVISGDPYNYHYWSSLKVAWTHCSALPPREIGEQTWRNEIAKESRRSIYVPLQGFPECSLDYGCTDPDLVSYYQAFWELVNMGAEKFHLLVKEHPNLLGERPSGFYRKLVRDKRVTVVPTYELSNSVLEGVSAVIVWSGTVGFEAALRGIPVFTLGQPYYQHGPRFCSINLRVEWATLNEHIERCREMPVSEAEQRELIIHLLSQLSPGHFRNDGGWRVSRKQDRRDAQQMGKAIRAHLQRQSARECLEKG